MYKEHEELTKKLCEDLGIGYKLWPGMNSDGFDGFQVQFVKGTKFGEFIVIKDDLKFDKYKTKLEAYLQDWHDFC